MLTSEQKSIIRLQQRLDRYQYIGILNEYQTISKDLVQEIVYTELNPYQHFLFKRVLHGLNMYSKEEIAQMHWDKKRRITKVWKRAQILINDWKQIICNIKANEILSVFGKNAAFLTNIPVTETIADYKNTLTLKDVGLSYEDLIIKFISEGLLPRNFFELNVQKQ